MDSTCKLPQTLQHLPMTPTTCLHRYGVVLKELDQRDKLRAIFEESVNKVPFLWSAWQELAATCEDRQSVSRSEQIDVYCQMCVCVCPARYSGFAFALDDWDVHGICLPASSAYRGVTAEIQWSNWIVPASGLYAREITEGFGVLQCQGLVLDIVMTTVDILTG